MKTDTALPTTVAADVAVRIAADLYGVNATAHPLPGEYDSNFHLCAASGEQFVLKIMHPQREPQFVDLQCRALQHVAERAPALPVSRVRLSVNDRAVEWAEEGGLRRQVWMLGYVPGRPLVEARPQARELLTGLGQLLGELDGALQSFEHSAAHRDLKWDLSRAAWIKDYIRYVETGERRAIVTRFVALYEAEVTPVMQLLRRSVIHGDANDHNVITRAQPAELPKVVGIVDFGDMHYGMTVSELAICAAYALLGSDDPVTAAAQVIAGYHKEFPLTETEIAVLFPLIAARLCVSVVNCAHRKTLSPEDSYITVSEKPAWEALDKLARVEPEVARCVFRHACGLPATPRSRGVVDWLRRQHGSFAPLMNGLSQAHVLDLSVGSLLTGADPRALEEAALARLVQAELQATGASVAVGRYGESRSLYVTPEFAASSNPLEERRTVHLGLDFFVPAGTPVHAPLNARVHAIANNSRPQDYGPVVILKHEPEGCEPFFTLYGHLALDCLERLQVGQPIAAGQAFAAVGPTDVNGGWTPHLHFQVIVDLLGLGTDFPGVVRSSQWALWSEISPDPNGIAGIPDRQFPAVPPTSTQSRQQRAVRLGGSLSLSYRHPLKIVRGWRQYLYDDTGRAYLDVYNNVPLVGHSHPHVVAAIQKQVALLNTNTRYLHDNINRYAQRLTALMPDPLKVCYFLNSASEANELALRMARSYTGRYDIMVLEHAYHGHTNTLIDISPYKFDGPGGNGRKPWVHVAPIADDFRGAYRRDDRDAGRKYAAHVAAAIASGVKPAAFIAESLPSVGGQIVFPPGYLANVYQHVRAAGGASTLGATTASSLDRAMEPSRTPFPSWSPRGWRYRLSPVVDSQQPTQAGCHLRQTDPGSLTVAYKAEFPTVPGPRRGASGLTVVTCHGRSRWCSAGRLAGRLRRSLLGALSLHNPRGQARGKVSGQGGQMVDASDQSEVAAEQVRTVGKRLQGSLDSLTKTELAGCVREWGRSVQAPGLAWT